ncbi:MAG: hypothetical protein ACP5OS_02555 [Leptospirillia bacterium]
MPARTRITLLMFAIPGLLDEYWLGNRFLDLPPSLRHPALLVVELPMLGLLALLVAWSVTSRRMTERGALALFAAALLMGGGGLLRLLLVLAAPEEDPLLKPHLFEVGGLVFAAMMVGIEGQAARRYFEKMRQAREGGQGTTR